MKLSVDGARLIEAFEGFVPHPYQDSVGVWTLGFGSTTGVGPRSPNVTRAQAEERMMREVDATYGAAVNALGLPLNQHQFDALVSFVYNCGPGAIGPASTIGKRLRAHDWHGAADALLAWDKAGGMTLPGLTRRRQAERALFLRPVADPLKGLTPDEARLCHELDALAHHEDARSRHRRASIRRSLTRRRKAIWRAAQASGWDRNHRRKRYAELKARTH